MKLDNITITETNCTIASTPFRIKESSIAFEILSSKLYADPILAIVRELLCNAYDSHKAAKTLNTPIKVNFPTVMDGNFSIRDYGTGLAKEDIIELYTTFFSSTKSETNDFTGCFGLGSKTPFSYTSGFSVNSYWHGIKYYFAAVKKDGYPHIYCVKEESTDEANGLEIIIPTNNDYNFLNKTETYIKHIPEIIVNSNKILDIPKLKCKIDNFSIYSTDSYKTYGNIIIKQGQNTYRLNESQYTNFEKNNYLHKALRKNDIVVDIPIGTLEITPNRESLSKIDTNAIKINNIFSDLVYKLQYSILNQNNLAENFDNDFYNQTLSEKYFTTTNKYEFRNYSSEGIGLNIKRSNISYIGNNVQCSRATVLSNIVDTIILFDEPFKSSHISVLKRRIDDNNLDGVHILYSFEHKQNILGLYYEMKNLLKVVNNVSEYDFNFRLTTYSRFCNKFPIIKRKKLDAGNKVIRLEKGTLKRNPLQTQDSTIDEIKYNNPSDCTLVISDCKIKEFINITHIFTDKIYNKDKKDFVKENIYNIFNLSLGKDINIISVKSSNLKYFKEYKKVTLEILIDIIKSNKDWYITSTKSIHTEKVKFLTYCKDTLECNFKNKTKQYIINSRMYKILDTVINYTNKTFVNNLYSSDIHELKRYNLIQPHNIKNDFSFYVNTLNTVYNLLKLKIIRAVSKPHRNTSYIYDLSIDDKLKLLNILKGDNKNVLF